MRDESFNDDELHELLEAAIVAAGLDREGPAYGVARQALTQGPESLSLKQVFWWNQLLPFLKSESEKETVRRVLDQNPD